MPDTRSMMTPMKPASAPPMHTTLVSRRMLVELEPYWPMPQSSSPGDDVAHRRRCFDDLKQPPMLVSIILSIRLLANGLFISFSLAERAHGHAAESRPAETPYLAMLPARHYMIAGAFDSAERRWEDGHRPQMPSLVDASQIAASSATSPCLPLGVAFNAQISGLKPRRASRQCENAILS